VAQLVGKGKAMEMVLAAEMINAEQGLIWGLVNHVCTMEELIQLAEKID
jgi:enoyl-CoA hydratase